MVELGFELAAPGYAVRRAADCAMEPGGLYVSPTPLRIMSFIRCFCSYNISFLSLSILIQYSIGRDMLKNDSSRICGQRITKTRLYNFDPLKPHFYIVKLGFTGVYIILLISAQKHRLWVHVFVRTASQRRFYRVPTFYVLSRNMKNI